MKNLVILVFLLILPALASAQEVPRYAVAATPTPVLNTPDFSRFFSGAIKLDPCRGVRPVEFVAFTGTLFTVRGALHDHGVTIYRVTTNDYPYPSKTGYFVDARFLREVRVPEERPRSLPDLPEIQRRLMAALGRPYVWGGDLKDGVPLLKEFYPQGDPLAGVDCSGLLYQATDGFTPRNTSALTSFGEGVPVAGLSAEQIARQLRPLDLIVWKGHVMVVLDHDSIIQSTMGCRGGMAGVHLSQIVETLQALMKRRTPRNGYPTGGAGGRSFVVRRWFRR